MNDSQKYVVFASGNEEYAIKIESILSIEKDENRTPLPHLPSYMIGITSVRGDLLPVLDFEKILGQPEGNESPQAKILVLKTDNLLLALRVKEASEILDLPAASIKELGLIAYSEANYFTGIAQAGDRLITVVDPGAMAHSLEGIKEIFDYMVEYKDQMSTRQ
ncbi:chemotaxis protein CheW [Jeotgalibacillus sp. ET6]|uniref:chemotaxis protein CheW n=1 Tax=Jeotgalibacillus sp. ET6 TaxID=3037260 RepID=UPI002418B669|nr:chemotaxis protein CheW [Jeotgalibacillus sp. ET6]MDG5470725.1 chemotaxis protein CheW [Jeotgalibacillus sp. ET6]